MKKIVVLSSGGDAPGMNAAIRAVVRAGIKLNMEVYGSYAGYQGIYEKTLLPMSVSSVANCIQHGGTILKTDRCEAFYEKTNRDQCRQFLADNKIDGLVVIGGDGSFRGAASLYKEGGPQVIGIPATIDNDISGTSYTIGFDTAKNTALNAIDKIRDTASSHNRNFIVEVMGRNAGFLAIDVGIAGGAEHIVIPEFEPTIEELAHRIRTEPRKKTSSIIVVAESDRPGRSVEISEQLNKLTGRYYRVCIIGHTQRGGAPTAHDRKIASLMGVEAVRALAAGETNKMVALNENKLMLTDFPDVDLPSRKFKDNALLEANALIC